jgi:hypothetical protein
VGRGTQSRGIQSWVSCQQGRPSRRLEETHPWDRLPPRGTPGQSHTRGDASRPRRAPPATCDLVAVRAIRGCASPTREARNGYSVLTRLPAGLRRSPADALRLLAHNCPASRFLGEAETADRRGARPAGDLRRCRLRCPRRRGRAAARTPARLRGRAGASRLRSARSGDRTHPIGEAGLIRGSGAGASASAIVNGPWWLTTPKRRWGRGSEGDLDRGRQTGVWFGRDVRTVRPAPQRPRERQ